MDNIITEGFCFQSARDAERAAQEKRKIEYLEERMDYSNHEYILGVYQKAIENRVFKTPVGICYLKELQQFLLDQPDVDSEEIPAIPLSQDYDPVPGETGASVQKKERPAEEKTNKSSSLTVSIILNVLLVIAVIAMFVIALNADQPNILNYEKEITNRYASWEQELTEREQAVRAKERELNIDPDTAPDLEENTETDTEAHTKSDTESDTESGTEADMAE